MMTTAADDEQAMSNGFAELTYINVICHFIHDASL